MDENTMGWREYARYAEMSVDVDLDKSLNIGDFALQKVE